MADVDALRESVARSCRMLGKLGMTREPAGHVSARVPDSDRILVKARGPAESGLRFTQPRDVITVSLADGKKLDGDDELAIPQEIWIHSEIYRARPEVQCVIHVHPVTVMLFTICDVPILPLYGAYDPNGLMLVEGGIADYDNSQLVSTRSQGEDLVAAIGQKAACLMRGHGITAVGTSVEDATLTAITLNELAEINYRAHLLGTPRPISDQDREVFLSRVGPTTPRPMGPGHYPISTWRYYCALLDEG